MLVLALYIALILALLGWGELAMASAGARARAAGQDLSLGDRGLLGLIVLTAAGQVVHLLVPLSSAVAVGVLVLGLAGCVLLARRILVHRAGLLFLPLAAAATLLQALTDIPNPDAGIYYVPTMLWNTEFPLVPGLGNVQGRLAYNSSEFIVASLLKLPVAEWQTAFLLNAFIATFVLVALFEHLYLSLRSAGRLTMSAVYAFVLLGGWCANHFYFSGTLGSLTTDLPQAMLVPYTAYFVMRAFDDRRAWPLVWATVMAAWAVSMKLSTLPLLVGVAAVLGVLVLGRRFGDRRDLAAAGLATAVMLVPWLVRGVLLSGCLVYPVGATCASGLPWAVRPELTAHEAQYIVDFGRGTLAAPTNPWEWIAPGMYQLVANHIGRLVLILLASGLVLWLTAPRVAWSGRRAGPLAALGSGAYWCAAVVGFTLAFTVVVSPGFRFALGSWYALGVLVLAMGLAANARRLPQQGWSKFVGVSLSALMALQVVMVGFNLLRTPQTPRVPTVVATPMTTASGLTVYVPRDEHCEATPLPCTPYFDPTLREVPFTSPFGERFYFQGSNTVAYRNQFPARD